MLNIVPAAPGWYVHETDDDGECLDPVIAWKPDLDSNGDKTLLPFVDGGPGQPPLLLTADAFKHYRRHLVYRPSHDPGRTGHDSEGAAR